MRLALISLASALLAGAAATQSGDSMEAAWRKPDATGARCGSCHSPDGIELSAFAFDRDTIVRRATPHVGVDDAALIAALLETNRAKMGGAWLDPMKDRPLQPGGTPLAGATPTDRDDAFIQRLPAVLPSLCGPPIRSFADAAKARDEVLALDPRNVAVGIPFDRLSEDGYHGKEHASLAGWLPDVPTKTSPAKEAAADAYVKEPTLAHLKALDAESAKLQGFAPIDQLAVSKYRSLLLLQHALRTKAHRGASLASISLLGPDDPFWNVAEVARRLADGDPRSMGLSPDLQGKKTGGPSFAEQMRQIRLAWYWAGWTLDPALTHSGFDGSTMRADYFTKFLWSDGPYPGHMAFMLTKKLVEDGCRPSNWPKTATPHFELQYAFFLVGNRLYAGGEPTDPAARVVFRRFTANSFRLSLLLLENDLKRTHAVVRPESQAMHTDLMKKYFDMIGAPPEDDALCARVKKEILAAPVAWR